MKKKVLYILRADGSHVGTLMFDTKSELATFAKKLMTGEKLGLKLLTGELDV